VDARTDKTEKNGISLLPSQRTYRQIIWGDPDKGFFLQAVVNDLLSKFG
jgi:hypothetical protein